MVLDATVGGANSNSYLTLTEAEEYFDTRYRSSAWDALTDEVKANLLIESTRTIDTYFRFNGEPSTEEQALAVPRNGMYTKDCIAIPNDIIPDELKDAVCETAYYITQTDNAETNNVEYEEASVGKNAVHVKFNKYYNVEPVATLSKNLLKPFGMFIGLGDVNSVQVRRA
jgi:hypothetical protein